MKFFKKVLKWFGLTVLVVLLLGGTFIAHSWYFKPVNINIFFARSFLQVALESPEMLSTIHVLEQFGIFGIKIKQICVSQTCEITAFVMHESNCFHSMEHFNSARETPQSRYLCERPR